MVKEKDKNFCLLECTPVAVPAELKGHLDFLSVLMGETSGTHLVRSHFHNGTVRKYSIVVYLYLYS
ncbi:MAG: hypothetical protein QXV32_06935 [Conexivisphaerales archaeon]